MNKHSVRGSRTAEEVRGSGPSRPGSEVRGSRSNRLTSENTMTSVLGSCMHHVLKQHYELLHRHGRQPTQACQLAPHVELAIHAVLKLLLPTKASNAFASRMHRQSMSREDRCCLGQ